MMAMGAAWASLLMITGLAAHVAGLAAHVDRKTRHITVSPLLF